MITLPLKQATKWAAHIAAELSPFCERLEVAGSIRRQAPMCHDIDLVVIARDWEGLQKRALKNARQICCGEQVFRLETTVGVQVDIYRARPANAQLFWQRPSNWGSLLLCRTGSARHNVMLVEKAKSLGFAWKPHEGVVNARNEILASETEEEIFKALHMGFVSPDRRVWGEDRPAGSGVNWQQTMPGGRKGE